MPDTPPHPTLTPKAEPPRKASSPPASANAPVTAPDSLSPKAGEKGALFRALVKAGADPVAAYTADEEAQTMVRESVAAQVQPVVAKLDSLAESAAERDRKLDALAESTAERDRKLDVLATEMRGLKETLATEVNGLKETLATEVSGLKGILATEVGGLKGILATEVSGLKEVLATEVKRMNEVSAAQTHALKRELRLIWGALAMLVTVLTAVFGILFTR